MSINIDFSVMLVKVLKVLLAKGIILNLSGDANDYVGK